MDGPPSCSSSSPSTSTATGDLQEADVFSDDSGVDVKPQCKNPHDGPLLKFSGQAESGKRNKRKSSEPKKRKDVLLMKRFRWDTDEEDDNRDDDDVFDVLERERPSSGDSGCVLDTTAADLSKVPDDKKKPRQWRKPKVEIPTVKSEATTTAQRQSVIRKHATTLLSHSSTNDDPSSRLSIPSGSMVPQPSEYDLEIVDDDSETSGRTSRGRPRNYKSMSRQRRIEANARERTRVHTISAAFENLRRAVPAYAHNQKLSKLAILRIASAYIVALACLNDQDYSQEQTRPTLAECVEQCTRTVQAEGRSRRRTTKE